MSCSQVNKAREDKDEAADESVAEVSRCAQVNRAREVDVEAADESVPEVSRCAQVNKAREVDVEAADESAPEVSRCAQVNKAREDKDEVEAADESVAEVSRCAQVNRAREVDLEAADESVPEVSRCLLIKQSLETAGLLESECVIHGIPNETLIIFTHGAGANMHSDFMQAMTSGLVHGGVDHGIGVLRFNFPYMRANVLDGKRRPPDRAPKILKDFNIHIAAIKREYSPKRIILMGKSMGGRMAAILAADTPVDGVICLGYPFIPLKGGEPRLAPIEECQAPLCVIQGERDKFGGKGQVELWPVMEKVRLHWLTDGDHSFKPRKSSGTTQEANLDAAVSHSIDFIRGLDA